MIFYFYLLFTLKFTTFSGIILKNLGLPPERREHAHRCPYRNVHHLFRSPPSGLLGSLRMGWEDGYRRTVAAFPRAFFRTLRSMALYATSPDKIRLWLRRANNGRRKVEENPKLTAIIVIVGGLHCLPAGAMSSDLPSGRRGS